MAKLSYPSVASVQRLAKDISQLRLRFNRHVSGADGVLGSGGKGSLDKQCHHCQTKWYFQALDDIPPAIRGGAGCDWKPGVGMAEVLKLQGTLASPCIQIPGEAFGITWITATVYAAGDSVANGTGNFIAETAGTSGGTPPVHTEGIVSDGGVDWRFVGSHAAADCAIQVVNPTCWHINNGDYFEATKQDGQPFAVDPGNIPAVAEFTLDTTLDGDAYGDGELWKRCDELPPEPVLDLSLNPVVMRLYNPCSDILVSGSPVRVWASPNNCCTWIITLVCC